MNLQKMELRCMAIEEVKLYSLLYCIINSFIYCFIHFYMNLKFAIMVVIFVGFKPFIVI